MKTQSIKPRGQRLFKSHSFKGKKKRIRRPLHISITDKNESWWFDISIGQWYKGGYSSKRHSINVYYCVKFGHHEVYSLKAAKRLIYKWDVPKGTKFKVGLPWIAYDFIITK